MSVWVAPAGCDCFRGAGRPAFPPRGDAPRIPRPTSDGRALRPHPRSGAGGGSRSKSTICPVLTYGSCIDLDCSGLWDRNPIEVKKVLVVTKKLPDVLYHYCSNAAFLSMISNREIWLSSLRNSNDSKEGSWCDELILKMLSEEGLDDHKLGRVSEHLEFNKKIDGYAFCLSENADQLSQWRGYSENGTGVSIGFNSTFFDPIT